jgi:lambda family phage portal protein
MATRRTRGVDASKVQNRYDAAGQGRRTKGWQAPASGPNRATVGLQTIRNRADDSVRNDWAAESSVQKWTTNLVGTGITPRWKLGYVNDLFRQWNRVADADGVLDYFGLQALVCRGWFAKGEVFARRRPRPLGTRLPVPLQIQILEAEFVPIFDATTWPGMPANHTIRQGIEFTKYGERAAYWMYREHPGDGHANTVRQDQLLRIPAQDVAHIFEVKRAGQIRGVSSLAPILMRLRASGDFEDAVLERQRLANLFTMFVTRALPPDVAANMNIDPDTGLPAFYGDDGAAVVGLEPGMSHSLLPGEDVKFASPPGAGTDHSDYLRSSALGTAAGQGLPYEVMSGDIRDVSDRTLRVVINEFRRFAEQRQWHTLIPQFCQRAIEWFVDAGVLAGSIKLIDAEAARFPEHSPQGWAYIHPVQDVEGKIKAIEAGLTSRDREITRLGDDPVQIDEERKAAKEREDELGLTPPPPVEPAAPAEPAPAPGVQQAAALMDLIRAQADNHQAFMTHVLNVVGSMGVRNDAPALQVHNHLPAPNVTVDVPAPTVNVAPAAVQVDVAAPNVTVEPAAVHVDVAAPTVNVEAPNVNVTNEVQPATVEVSLPARKTETTFNRDNEGLVKTMTQVERTLN